MTHLAIELTNQIGIDLNSLIDSEYVQGVGVGGVTASVVCVCGHCSNPLQYM